ncbi:MAG: thioredoxin family protein [Bacteroidetes bacterium]|jgi:thioredoxin-related protein|nr:thioredoxin family protein [Bacteroidota bacterium]
MRKLTGITTIIVLSLVIFGLSFTSSADPELAIGAKLPKSDKNMIDVSGKETNLNTLKTAKGLLVIFSCNTCPYVRLSESRIKEYSDFASQNGIGVALVNSNEAQRADGEDDSMDAMKKYYADQKLSCSYLVDTKSEVADAFGATRTPQCFLFDKDGVLVYKGAIDDNVKDPKAVKEFYLKDALTAVSGGKKPVVNSSKSIGCTIKRLE